MNRRELGSGAWIDLYPEWLDRASADQYFEILLATVPWEQGKLVLFGKSIDEPRLSAWFGERDYTYSGRALRARALPAPIKELAQRAEASAACGFNSVLLNLYRTGSDSMGLHSDDEPELGPNPVIASVSLGAERRFVLRPKRTRRAQSLNLKLPHGSLLLMGGSCQHELRHGLPKQPGVTSPRINLTFRYITQ